MQNLFCKCVIHPTALLFHPCNQELVLSFFANVHEYLLSHNRGKMLHGQNPVVESILYLEDKLPIENVLV